MIIFNLIFFSKSDSQTRSIKIKRVQLNPVNTNSRYQDLIYIVNQLINFILQLSKKNTGIQVEDYMYLENKIPETFEYCFVARNNEAVT